MAAAPALASYAADTGPGREAAATAEEVLSWWFPRSSSAR